MFLWYIHTCIFKRDTKNVYVYHMHHVRVIHDKRHRIWLHACRACWRRWWMADRFILKSVQKLCAKLRFLWFLRISWTNFNKWTLFRKILKSGIIWCKYFGNKFKNEEEKWRWKKWALYLLNVQASYWAGENFNLFWLRICKNFWKLFYTIEVTGPRREVCKNRHIMTWFVKKTEVFYFYIFLCKI